MSRRGADRSGRMSLVLVRALLLLYPPGFRRRFGGEMVADFRDRFDERASRGRKQAVALVLRTAADMLVCAVREWVRPAAGRGESQGVAPTPDKRGSVMDHLRLDLRFALRSLARRPTFTAIAIVTLALGIGANTAIFSVVHGVLLRSLPYWQPDRLVMVWAHGREDPTRRGNMSQPDIESVREMPAIAAAEGYGTSTWTLTGSGVPEPVDVARVTGGLLSLFGLTPQLGRDLRHEENDEGAARVIVVSHDFWQQRLGGRADVIGAQVELSEYSYEVVGVAPPGFDYPDRRQVWTPWRLTPGCGRGCHIMRAIARLAPGVPLERASADLARVSVLLSQDFPDSNATKGLRFEQFDDYVVADVREALWILFGAVGVVLLIACANVANLLLVRASSRRPEVAVRAALGASRGRLVAQVLVESLVLAFAGAALGLLLARGGVGLLKRLSPGTIPRLDDVALDGTVLIFALAVTCLVALLFGLSPALRLARTPLTEGLRTESRGGQLPRETWSRAVLLSVEVGLSLVLLVGAGLLVRTLVQLQRVDMGFDGREVIRFSLSLPTTRYAELERIVAFYGTLEERLSAIPGVESTGSAYGAPLTSSNISGDLRFEGRPEPEPGARTYASIHPTTPGYFPTIGLDLLRGRALERTDDGGSLPVAVVNDAFVRENFGPGEDPIGKRFEVSADFGYGSHVWTIVGIVGDVRRRPTMEPRADVYVPLAQFGPGFLTVHVRGRPGASNLVPAIRDEVQRLDANLLISNLATITEAIREETAPTRFYLLLISLFAALAVTLAAVGLYGVVAYLVSRRTREIGIRLALGAPRIGIARLMLHQVLWPTAFGIVGGLLAARAASRVMSSLLFRVQPADPLVLGGVTVLVLAVCVLAALLPARRATRVDPANVLRSEA